MSRFRLTSRSQAPMGPVGKVFISLFFLVFFAAGVFFCGLVLREAFRNISTWSWRETPCAILSSEVSALNDKDRKTGNFYARIRYEYTFAAEVFTSTKVGPQSKSYPDYSEAAGISEAYPAGGKSVCFVNPSNPSEVVLKKGSAWMLPVVLFPLIFVAIGAGGIYFTWRGKGAGAGEAKIPISDRAGKFPQGRKFMVVFFGLFLLAGTAFFFFIFVRPVFKTVSARNWPAVPCVVISSEVRSHSSDDGTTYSVNILFEYERDGKRRRSNRYSFVGGSSSGRSGKQAIVREHPPGSETICYVNPANPAEAVLDRGLTPVMWFGLIPLAFVIVGAGGLVHVFRAKGAGGALRGTGMETGRSGTVWLRDEPIAAATLVLKPKVAPWAKVLGALFFAAFWNGIVSVFLTQVIKNWQRGRPNWFETLFLIPFVLIGLFLILLVFYFVLALFNPRPRLRVTPGSARLGETLRVEWDITGRANVLERLLIRLEGREEATYRRGTTTYTDKNVFADIEIANVASRSDMRSGVAKVVVPRDLMHSFAAANNKIVWALHLKGSIARWPDVEEEFGIEVLPATPGQTEVS